MKKAITLILSLVLIFSLCLPAAAVKNEEHPTIYVLGARVTSIHAADGTQLFPNDSVDAATCLFPETSYFVKDIYHDTFPYAINSFAISLMNSEATVSSGEHPQYVRYTGWSEPLVPIEGLDEDGTKEDEPKFMVFIRFFTAILNFIKKLFNGEISLG